MTLFQYDSAILESFPTIIGGIIVGHNVHNSESPPELKTAIPFRTRTCEEPCWKPTAR